MNRRIAFVVQRYGEDVIGGSEAFCRQVAERMSKYFRVEVLTTCAIDYISWKNELPPGTSELNGVAVRRFSNDFGRRFGFRVLNSLNLRGFKLNRMLQHFWMKWQGPYSSSLFQYIKDNQEQYDLFVFFTYLYCTTYFGLPPVRHKSVLIPTAHDEKPIYLDIFDQLFSLPRLIIFLSPEERDFVARRFGTAYGNFPVIGGGVDCSFKDEAHHRQTAGEQYIIYAGRIDSGKGCGLLFEYFTRYKDSVGGKLKLCLIGRSHMELPCREDILYLGFVPEEEKWRLIGGSLLFVLPSPYESFSLAALEAMACGVPVLANGASEVVRGHCRRGGGGVCFNGYDSFAGSLTELLTDEKRRREMGEAGRNYVRSNYDWAVIEKKYVDVFNELIEQNKAGQGVVNAGRD